MTGADEGPSAADHAALGAAFLQSGPDYDRYRPGFPDTAVDLAVGERGVERVLDLAAGTGKLTAALAARIGSVVAVDPSAAMLEVLRERLPRVDARIGTAESIPLDDASVDLVTVAQAFHWFDRDAACAEIARVLTPTGRLALLWNEGDPACAWDARCRALVHPRGGPGAADVPLEPEELPGFEPERAERFRRLEPLSRADYLGRWGTVSRLLAADDAQRAELFAEIGAVLDADPETAGADLLPLRQVTDVLVYRRTAPSA